MQIFVDMDGVLADFDRHYKTVFDVEASKLLDNVDWQKVRGHKDFYANIPPMHDFDVLWSYVTRVGQRLGTPPIVLTGIPSSVEEAEANKRAWITRHLGDAVPVICCLSKDKCLHGLPGDVLIDDWEKHRQAWEDMGGYWITHTSATSSCYALDVLLSNKERQWTGL